MCYWMYTLHECMQEILTILPILHKQSTQQNAFISNLHA